MKKKYQIYNGFRVGELVGVRDSLRTYTIIEIEGEDYQQPMVLLDDGISMREVVINLLKKFTPKTNTLQQKEGAN